jgi:predicted transcriptional regulator
MNNMSIPNMNEDKKVIRRVISVKVKIKHEKPLLKARPIDIFKDLTSLFTEIISQIGEKNTIEILNKHNLAYNFLKVLP